MAFEYKGITYQNLCDAANKLGYSQSYLTTYKNANHYTELETIEKVDSENHKRKENSGQKKECVVFGVHYKSQCAAARKLGVPYISVMSKVDRSKECEKPLNFAEALEKIFTDRKQNAALESFSISALKKEDNYPIEKSSNSFQGLYNKLDARGYKPAIFSLDKWEMPIIGINHCFSVGRNSDIWIVIKKSQVEIIVSNILSFENCDTNEKLKNINTINFKYSGIKLWIENGAYTDAEVFAGCSIIKTKTDEIPIMMVIKMISKIISDCDKIIKEFG